MESNSQVLKVFKEQGGMLKTSDAISLGVHPRDLYGAVECGELEQISRGLYRVSALSPLSNPDLVVVG